MRVLLVSHRFPPEGITGVERYCASLAAELSRAGDEVHVVTGSQQRGTAPAAVRHERLAAGVHLYRLACPKERPARFLAQHERLEELFTDVLDSVSPDVVHVNHLIHLSPRFVELARMAGAGVVLSLHDHYFSCPLHLLRKRSGALCGGSRGGKECARSCFAREGDRALPRWRARAAYFRALLEIPDVVLCPSRSLAETAQRTAAAPDRIRVLPLGLPWTPPRPLPAGGLRRKGTLKLAVLGRFGRHKGVHVLVRALSRASLDRVELDLHGTGPVRYLDAVRQQAERVPGLHLRMRGSYELKELPARLAPVDFVVVPSLWPEAYVFVAREALALGVPVLASRLGALPELVVDGENGYTFDPRAPGELGELLRRLDGDDRVLATLREGARRTAVVSMQRHAQGIRSVYEDAIRNRARAQPAGLGEETSRLFERLLALGYAGPSHVRSTGAPARSPPRYVEAS